MNKKKFEQFSSLATSMLHICIPFNSNFLKNIILLDQKFNPEIIIIHSSIKSGTTSIIHINKKTNYL